MRYSILILTILLSAQINLTYAQEPNSNERKTKALIQMMSSLAVVMSEMVKSQLIGLYIEKPYLILVIC